LFFGYMSSLHSQNLDSHKTGHWTVIINPNPNLNRSPNLVLTVQISTIQISPGNFTVENLIAQISYGYRCMVGSVYTSGTGHNSSCCMSGTRRTGRKNITSETRRAASNTKRREVSFFSALKNLRGKFPAIRCLDQTCALGMILLSN